MEIIKKEFSQLFLKIYFLIFLISFLGLAFKNSRTFFIIIFSFFVFFHILRILRFKYIYTNSKFLLTYFLVFMLIIFHVLLFPELNSIFLFRIIRFVFVCITIYLIAQNIEISYSFLNKFKRYFNTIVLMLFLVDILFSLNFVEKNESYSMGLSYSLLFYLSIYSIFKKKKKKIDYLKILYMILFIFRYGSRGAILAYLVLVFTYLLNSLYFNKRYKLLFVYIITSIGMYCIFFKTNFIGLVFQKIADFGIKSRTIILFQQKEIHLSGRGEIYKNVYNSILKDPFSIKGIFSDFFVTGINDYSHNIVLELLYQFGVILGGFLLFIILIIFFFSVYHKQKDFQDNLIFIFAVISIVHLMISGTLWESVEFWTWVGLYLKRRNYENYILKNSVNKKV